jgi:hypothetical protein
MPLQWMRRARGAGWCSLARWPGRAHGRRGAAGLEHLPNMKKPPRGIVLLLATITILDTAHGAPSPLMVPLLSPPGASPPAPGRLIGALRIYALRLMGNSQLRHTLPSAEFRLGTSAKQRIPQSALVFFAALWQTQLQPRQFPARLPIARTRPAFRSDARTPWSPARRHRQMH